MRREAAAAGYDLVPRAQAANWQPVFASLIQRNMPVWAVKLWAEITRYEELSGHLNIRAANEYVSAIRSHNQPLPKGNEHPDLDPARLEWYLQEPWSERHPT